MSEIKFSQGLNLDKNILACNWTRYMLEKIKDISYFYLKLSLIMDKKVDLWNTNGPD